VDASIARKHNLQKAGKSLASGEGGGEKNGDLFHNRPGGKKKEKKMSTLTLIKRGRSFYRRPTINEEEEMEEKTPQENEMGFDS